MAIYGETGHGGSVCSDCGIKLDLQVLRSRAGYYVGTQCNCGPYSRESGYYKTEDKAYAELRRKTVHHMDEWCFICGTNCMSPAGH